jgi:hypothetical protein
VSQKLRKLNSNLNFFYLVVYGIPLRRSRPWVDSEWRHSRALLRGKRGCRKLRPKNCSQNPFPLAHHPVNLKRLIIQSKFRYSTPTRNLIGLNKWITSTGCVARNWNFYKALNWNLKNLNFRSKWERNLRKLYIKKCLRKFFVVVEVKLKDQNSTFLLVFETERSRLNIFTRAFENERPIFLPNF